MDSKNIQGYTFEYGINEGQKNTAIEKHILNKIYPLLTYTAKTKLCDLYFKWKEKFDLNKANNSVSKTADPRCSFKPNTKQNIDILNPEGDGKNKNFDYIKECNLEYSYENPKIKDIFKAKEKKSMNK